MAEIEDSVLSGEHNTDTESNIQASEASEESCKCFRSEERPDHGVMLDALDISSQSELQLAINDISSGHDESSHGDLTLNFIKRKLEALKEYKEAIIDLCHNQLEYHNSIEKLEVAWNCVAALIVNSSPEATKNLLHWVVRQTLHLMLVGEWTTLPSAKRNNIRVTIEKSLPVIKCAPNSINRCEYILQYFNNPWSDKRLLSVLYGEARLLTKCDLEYLTAERGCMIVLRLQMLCATKCDEMAFTLSSKALLALRTVNTDHELRKSTSVDHVYFIFDIYLCLVHKYVGVNKFIEEVKRLGLYDALLLIKRNINAESNCSRLIKFRAKVAKLSANIIIATLMVDSLTDDNKQYYCAILKEWLKMHQKLPVRKFRDIARKLFSTACSSKHLHLACQIIKDMKIIEWRELLLELYVRVITADLNELELLKSEKTCSAEIVLDSEVTLSYRYIQIADLLKEQHPDLTNECILTAFSLNPTPSNYYLVQAAAYQKQLEMSSKGRRSNQSATEFSTGPDYNDSTEANLECVANKTSNPMSQNQNEIEEVDIIEPSSYDVLAAPNLILDSIETIDLPSDIRIDLSVLLSSPRVKFLSWFQTWPELENHCQKLLKPGVKLEIVRQSLAVANDHLQFLNLDYDQFRNLPENDGPGIEKGYEIFVESDEETFNNETYIASDENCPRKKRSSKLDRQRKHFGSPFTQADSSLEQINSKLRELNEKRNPTEAQDNLDDNIIQNILKQQSNLISPFNNYLLQYLSQQSPHSLHSTTEFDTLFRTLYIQQLQAQLQLSQTYTRALQQQVILPKDSHQKKRLPISRPKNVRRRVSKIQHKPPSTFSECEKNDQTTSMQLDPKIDYFGSKLIAENLSDCLDRELPSLSSMECGLPSNSMFPNEMPDITSRPTNYSPTIDNAKQEKKIKLDNKQMIHINIPQNNTFGSDINEAPSIIQFIPSDSLTNSNYLSPINGEDIKSEKVLKQNKDELDLADLDSFVTNKPESRHKQKDFPSSDLILDTQRNRDETVVFETGSCSVSVQNIEKDAVECSSIMTVQSRVTQISPKEFSQCIPQIPDDSSMHSNEMIKNVDANLFDLPANKSPSTERPREPSQPNSPNSEKNFEICYKPIKRHDQTGMGSEELREPTKPSNGMTFLVDTFESKMTFDSGNKGKGEIDTKSSSEAQKQNQESMTASNMMNPRIGNFEHNTGQDISALQSIKPNQSYESLVAYTLSPNLSAVQDSDTDTEVDENENDDNASIVKRFENRNDTDSDTDSSENHSLVVQLPRRTYSRVSGNSDRANPPHQQQTDQQSSASNSDKKQRMSLAGQCCDSAAIKKQRYSEHQKAKKEKLSDMLVMPPTSRITCFLAFHLT